MISINVGGIAQDYLPVFRSMLTLEPGGWYSWRRRKTRRNFSCAELWDGTDANCFSAGTSPICAREAAILLSDQNLNFS